jgi:hypothetical protein
MGLEDLAHGRRDRGATPVWYASGSAATVPEKHTDAMKRIALVPCFALALPAFAASALADTLDVGDGVKI